MTEDGFDATILGFYATVVAGLILLAGLLSADSTAIVAVSIASAALVMAVATIAIGWNR